MALEPGMRPESPQDWIAYLTAKLETQRNRTRRYREYYDSCEHTLAFAQEKFKNEFGGLFYEWRDNFCALVVDSISERLRIDGFRMGDTPEADKEAQQIWQRNYLDSDSNAAHIEALVTGESYLWVWGDENGNPIISPESSDEVTVQYTPGSRHRLDAALKLYCDDWGVEHVTLILPDSVWTSDRGPKNGSNWSEPVSAKNPLGVVPVVPLRNRARLGSYVSFRRDFYRTPHEGIPYSEIHPIIPLQDAITKIAADAIVASEFAAYPQRLIAGIELPEDENGQLISPIRAGADRLMMFEDENVQWGQFQAADLNNYVNFINMLVQHISSISRVPPHYFLVGGANFPSGEALAAAEAGLVSKARERMLYFGESWEQAMRLAFAVLGDPRAEAFNAETIWCDPEYRSDSMRVDALTKLRQGLDVPTQQLWEDYGYTPNQIERFGEMRKEDLARQVETMKATAAVTGQIGGQAPAGNGTKADDPTKPPRSNVGNVARKTNNG